MFKNLKFSRKIMLILSLTSFFIILSIGSVTFIILKKEFKMRAEEDLRLINDLNYDMIEATVDTTIKNYLVSMAQKIKELAGYNYSLYKKGEITENEAYNRTKKIMLDPGYSKIGKSGYISGVNIKGNIVIHPSLEGENASDRDVIKKAIKEKEDYIEYSWTNPGDKKPRDKASAFAFFEPWDLIISPNAYKDEIHDFIDLNDLSIKLGKNGNTFVLDKNAVPVFYSQSEKQISIDSKDKNGKSFVHDMVRLKNGKIIYYWKGKKDKEWRKKIVLFKHYKKLDWLICSGVYLDDLYAPIYKLRSIIIFISIIASVFIFFFSFFMGRSVSKPVTRLAKAAKSIGKGNLNVKIPVESNDEIGTLSEEFNKMAANLKEEGEEITRMMVGIASANQAKDKFLANMSHEIRTPLTAILGNTELLEPYIKDEQNRARLEDIKNCTKTLKEFIDDTLDMSRIEAKKLKIIPAPVNIYAVLNEIRSNFYSQVTQKNLNFSEEIDPGILQYLEIDKLRLKQVLINLVSNAVKYTDKGYIKLIAGIDTKGNRDDNKRIDLVLAVEDTGCGIPTKYQKIIFEPFERPGEKADRTHEGSGLGLAISKGIIELMGGEISVKSEVGKGSVFTVLLKDVRVSTEQEIATDDETFDYSGIIFENQRLLVVDDEEKTRQIIKGYLDGANIQVMEAENGFEAVELVKKFRPELVLMDIKMPIMDGITAVQKIREDEELKDIPILAFTAFKTDQDDVEKYGKMFDRYIFKPLSKAKLFFELKQFLKHERVEKENAEHEQPLELDNIEISKAVKKILPDIIRELEEYREMWESVFKSNNFNEYKAFGQKIKESGDKKNVEFLSNYGQAIIANAEMSRIKKVKAILGYYPGLIEKLKLIIKET